VTGSPRSGPVRLRPPRPCPICGKPSTRDAYPFCSTRCADVDLKRWLSEDYRIPEAPPDGEDAASKPEPDET